MTWIKKIHRYAVERKSIVKEIKGAEFRLKSISTVIHALQVPKSYDIFIVASTPTEGAFASCLKALTIVKIRNIILDDLNKAINAELNYIEHNKEKLENLMV